MSDITCAAGSDEGVETAALRLGDPVPAYTPTWLKGGPVPWLEPGRLYLVECWASWCGPCVGTIPHLDAMHRKYGERGLTVIGQNVWEEDREAIRTFVEQQGDAMSYPVAVDDGSFARQWLQAAGVNGIPHAFVVRDGKLLWRCHPGELKDDDIERMLDGSFDVAAALSASEAKAAMYQRAMAAMEDGNWTSAQHSFDEIAREEGDDGFGQFFQLPLLLGLGKFEAAAELAREMASAAPGKPAMDLLGAVTKFRVGAQSPEILTLALEEADKALTSDRSPYTLMMVAEVKAIAGQFPHAVPLMEEALKGAEREGKVPSFLKKLHKALEVGHLPTRADMRGWEAEGEVPL